MPDTGLSLGDLIDMQIRQQGPMSLAAYMGLCLTHPTRGYYRKADPSAPAAISSLPLKSARPSVK